MDLDKEYCVVCAEEAKGQCCDVTYCSDACLQEDYETHVLLEEHADNIGARKITRQRARARVILNELPEAIVETISTFKSPKPNPDRKVNVLTRVNNLMLELSTLVSEIGKSTGRNVRRDTLNYLIAFRNWVRVLDDSTLEREKFARFALRSQQLGETYQNVFKGASVAPFVAVSVLIRRQSVDGQQIGAMRQEFDGMWIDFFSGIRKGQKKFPRK